jgi:hypothetical protein
MTSAAERAALVTAADGVTAGDFTVRAHESRPAAPAPGDAWVRWRGAQRDAGFLFVNTWAVLVVVAADETTADAMADQLGYALAGALEPVMFVDAITPVVMATSAGDMQGLQLTGRSE